MLKKKIIYVTDKCSMHRVRKAQKTSSKGDDKPITFQLRNSKSI